MRLIDKKIKMTIEALRACELRADEGLNVTDDIKLLDSRLIQLKKEKKGN